jgi:hypothetical protein
MCNSSSDSRAAEGAKTASAPFSVRQFLSEREALVVHFSTPMRQDQSLRFPDDLIRAQTLGEKGLCCSTIQAGDVGPGQPGIDPANANAVGCVGIILDVNDQNSVCAVHPSDCATSRDPDGDLQYDGDDPTAESCAKSIDRRTSSNEWVVKQFGVVGIYVFQPIYVQTMPPGSVERQISLQMAFAPFSGLRVFSSQNGQFVELDRQSGEWSPVEYGSIISR